MNYRCGFLLFLSVLTIFRFYFSAYFDLTPDEAYYWFWSRHPALSYFDHPPMVAYLIKMSTAVFGDREWAVRLPAMVMGLGDTLLIYLLGKKVFKSAEAGIFGALILNSLLIFSTGMVIITPDSPQLFFWVLTIYFSYIAVIEKKENYWLLTGLSLGMGLLSKYTMILFVPSVFLFLLFTPEVRHHLISLRFWLALFIALIIFSPVVLWNYQNHWISFLFQFHHGMDRSESFGWTHVVEFLGGQAGIFSPFIFLGFFWALWQAYQVGKRAGLRQFSFIFWTVVPVFVFFLWNSLRISVGPNWPVFAQSGSILLLGGFFYQKLRLRKGSFWTSALIIFSIGVSYSLMMLVHLQAFSKIIPLSVEMDRTNDLTGWNEIQRINRQFPETIGWPVIVNSHTMVGEASFYLKKENVYQMGEAYRISDLSRVDSNSFKGDTFLLLTFEDDPFSDKVINQFRKVVPLADIPVFVYRDRKKLLVRTYRVFRGENFLNLP
ncbi:MAG TPA: glycosyltransferase family 39 protein [Nitrospiria bacterium]|nr:glycosyltransferase family 39 protein [Nitrospiria bacterium]